MSPNNQIVTVVLARCDSRRLPAKVLREVGGRAIIEYVLDRAERVAAAAASRVVLATTDRPIDDSLVDYASARGTSIYRGSAHDVALRVLDCARAVDAQVIVRINGDSPFADPALIGRGLSWVLAEPDVDLVTNVMHRDFPYGIAVEVMRRNALERAYVSMDHSDREHVTRHLYTHADDFTIRELRTALPQRLRRQRLVVDTEEDLERFSRAAATLGSEVTRVSYRDAAELYARLEGDL